MRLEAAGLLAAGNLPMAAVATRVGFPDIGAFSRRFRAVMGQPLSRYRQLAEQGPTPGGERS